MKFLKEWKCELCNKSTDKFEIIRISKELYGCGRYKQFYKNKSIDLCKDCYDKLLKDVLERDEM